MSTSHPNEPAAQAGPTNLIPPLPSPPITTGRTGWVYGSMTVGRYEEIRRRFADGRGIRERKRKYQFSNSYNAHFAGARPPLARLRCT